MSNAKKRWLSSTTVVVGLLFALIAAVLGVVSSVRFASYGGHVDPYPTPVPPQSFNAEMDEELRRAWRELREGGIAFRPKEQMKQGVAQIVVVKIADRPSRDAFGALPADFAVERLKTSATMKAQLSGDAGVFAIRPLSSEQQALVGDAADWKWVVTPQIAGDHRLYLTVTALLRLSNGDIESRDVLVKQAIINVAVNRRWQVSSFFRRNWQWLLGSPLVLGGLAWLINRLRKKRSNRAGY